MLENLLITWAITTVSLLIMSKLPLGIEIKDITTALVAAFVLGLLNVFVRPVLGILAFPITLLTLGLFSFVLNAIVFQIVAVLVRGFNLRGGCLSALVGPIVLSLLNGLILSILPVTS